MADKEAVEQVESTAAESVEEKSLLDQILEDGRMAREEQQKGWAKDVISEFVSQIMDETITVSSDTEAMINTRIGQIDKLV